MPDPIVLVDSSTVREGKLAELKAAMAELAGFVDANEPRPILYHVHFSDDGATMTVVQVHPDSASVELHMDLAGEIFAKLTGFLDMRTMDVYGAPSEALLERIRAKAQLLGGKGTTVHPLHAGFARIAPR